MNFVTQLRDSFLLQSEQYLNVLPNFLIGVIGFVFFWFLANRLQRFSKKRLTKSMDDPLLASFLAKMIRVTLLIIGFLFFLKMIGWGNVAAGILASAGLTAFVVGFALKDIGENFLAGIMMAFSRPFKIGDTVEVNGISGTVQGLTLRQTEIKTFDGKDVYVPNSIILKNPLYNNTIDGFMRYDFELGLPIDADVNQAIDLVDQVMTNIPGILLPPKKDIGYTLSKVDSNSIRLKIYFWIGTYDTDYSIFNIKKEAIANSITALRKAGIHLPHHVVEVHRKDVRS